MRGWRGAAAMAAALSLLACAKEEGSAEELCTAVASSDVTSVFRGFDPTDPQGSLEKLRTARVELGDLHDAAPDEVRDDLQTEIDYVQALIDTLEQVEQGDATEAALQIQAVTDAHPGVDDASANLAVFAEEEC